MGLTSEQEDFLLEQGRERDYEENLGAEYWEKGL